MKKESYSIIGSEPVDKLIDDGVNISYVFWWTLFGVVCAAFWLGVIFGILEVIK